MNVSGAARVAWRAVRHPRQSLDHMLQGGPVYPLLVLFGLNTVDELDRAAFGILLPEIREEFGLSITALLSLFAIVGVIALGCQLPIGVLADRTSRTRLALGGASVWAIASLTTGLAGSVVVLATVRSASGLGAPTRSTAPPTRSVPSWGRSPPA